MDTGYKILDAGQIMDDLIPICRPEGGVFIGDAGYIWSSCKDLLAGTGFRVQDAGYKIQDTGC